MQLKKCRYPTCNQLISIDQANPFCKVHGKNWHKRNFNFYRKTNYQDYNKHKRDPKANAFYHSAPWRRLSADLRRQSIWTCQCCGRTYDGKSFLVVDHIIPLKVEPKLKLDRKNLWVLCKKCHFWKTKLQQQIYGSSLIANLDTSKAWPREKIQKWILSHEKSKQTPRGSNQMRARAKPSIFFERTVIKLAEKEVESFQHFFAESR